MIAYRQPVTRFQVAAVRGVNVDGVFRTLASRGLIQRGNRPRPGSGDLYGTTPAFLEQLGLNDLDQLPDQGLPPRGRRPARSAGPAMTPAGPPRPPPGRPFSPLVPGPVLAPPPGETFAPPGSGQPIGRGPVPVLPSGDAVPAPPPGERSRPSARAVRSRPSVPGTGPTLRLCRGDRSRSTTGDDGSRPPRSGTSSRRPRRPAAGQQPAGGRRRQPRAAPVEATQRRTARRSSHGGPRRNAPGWSRIRRNR